VSLGLLVFDGAALVELSPAAGSLRVVLWALAAVAARVARRSSAGTERDM
jgi:hypothetical protein